MHRHQRQERGTDACCDVYSAVSNVQCCLQVDVATYAHNEFALFESDTEADLRDGVFMVATKLDPVPEPAAPAPVSAATAIDVDAEVGASDTLVASGSGLKGTHGRRSAADIEMPPQMVPYGAKRVRVPARRVNADIFE